MDAWSGFFIAQVGASAALAGLIFVAVSLSLARIIATPHLPQRAFQALIVLLEILIVSSLAIVPQPSLFLGIEVLVIAGTVWILVIKFDREAVRVAGKTYHARAVQRMVLSQAAALFFLVGALATLIQGIGGVYWFVPAVICSYLVALLDAWVLLVEINR